VAQHLVVAVLVEVRRLHEAVQGQQAPVRWRVHDHDVLKGAARAVQHALHAHAPAQVCRLLLREPDLVPHRQYQSTAAAMTDPVRTTRCSTPRTCSDANVLPRTANASRTIWPTRSSASERPQAPSNSMITP
jgi:hypothetical protein